MSEFKALVPNAEVNGQTILSVIKGMEAFSSRATQILEDNGIRDIKANKWYSQQNWLNAFKEIQRSVGSKTLTLIGMKIPDNAEWPAHIKTFEEALASIDMAYHMNHKVNGKLLFDSSTGKMGEGIGHYNYERTGTNEITMTCNNPYPCDFDKGIIKAVSTKFRQARMPQFFEHVHKGCRKNGGDQCTYIITW